jgi:ABC-2 type transport system permease protein
MTKDNLKSAIKLAVIPFYALFMREIHRFFKVIIQTVVTPLITTVLYLLIFGLSIGKNISLSYDVTYLAFLIPGLVIMATLRNAFDNSIGTIITSKFCGELEDLRRAPISPYQIVWAQGLASIFRGIIVGVITLAIGMLFYWIDTGAFLTIKHPFMLFIFLTIGGLTFAHLGLTIAIMTRSFEQVNAINSFILLPLIYLGGVFFSLDHLHPFWHMIAQLNPLIYLVNGVRYSILGVSDVTISYALIFAFVTWLVLHITALVSLRKGSYHSW